jgi:hypothetical protein
MAKKKRKKPGPLRTTGPGMQINIRCHADFLSRLDKWRAAQDDKPTRNQAILRLAERALSTSP